MPVYRYQAIDKRGRDLSGIMPAHDESNLEQKLKALGLWLTEASQERAQAASSGALTTSEVRWFRLRSKHRRRELIDFCTVMTYQIRAGVPLAKALEAAGEDCKDPAFKKVLGGLQAHLESGLHFYEALAHYPAVFSSHFINVIRAGEMSSKLPETFEDLRKYLEWTDQLIADVRQATLYPSIVMTIVACFTLLLFSFVIPRFAELLSKLHVKQPLITQIIFSAGDVAKSTWFIWLPVLLGILIGVPIARRASPRFAYAFDKMKLHWPIFGELNLMLALSRFTHNLAILYRSGIPIIQALELCQHGLIANAVIEKAVGEAKDQVKTGSTITEAMRRQAVFPAMVLRMVAMGEASGNLDQALDNVASYYTDIVPRRIKAVFTVFEPAIMLFLIFMVGCVAIAIYLPILSLMDNIGR